MSPRTRSSGGRLRWLVQKGFALLLFAIGATLGWLGWTLISLGGSAWYLLAGVAIGLAGILLWRRDQRGAWLYALMLIGTLVWALWESGFDGWALAPRLAAPAVLGLLLWAIERSRAARFAGRIGGLLLALLLVLLWRGGGGEGSPQPGSPLRAIAQAPADGDWPHYGRDIGGSRFSPLAQIARDNVGQLAPAWSFRTGHSLTSSGTVAFEATPIKIDETLYLCTPYNDIIALDAETGKQRWRFNPRTDSRKVGLTACRGVSWFRDPAAKPDALCADRIITATIDGQLFAADAKRGIACPGFGNKGRVSLLPGMGIVDKGYYYVSSAPQIIRGRIVLGGWVSDNQHIGEPSGVIRAFDAVTGAFSWAFDVGRPDFHGLPPEGQKFTPATPNSWAPISADDALGLVYLPTGNSVPDWYGGMRRPFDEKYSSSVVALDAESGAVRWSFQTTHHDLWDYDVPSQPTLYDMPIGGRRVPALVQATKRGEIFVLDRRTGQPLTAVEERRVPRGNVPGERLSPTQPFSVGMPSFAGPMLTEAMMWGLTPIDQAWCRIQFRKARWDGTMTPPGVDRPIIVYPGYMGGSDWGGVAIDKDRDIMIVNSMRMALRTWLIPRTEADRMGIKPISSKVHGNVGGASAQAGTPYAVDVKPFLSPLFVPCQQPPFSTISAVDMKTRKLLWTRPLGTARDSGPFAISSHLPFTIGTPATGGSVTTRGGLTFIGAAADRYLRAFDTATGQELWKASLPAGGQATPMTYWSKRSGRQFVVIAAGGNFGLAIRPGDHVVAFALPKGGAR